MYICACACTHARAHAHAISTCTCMLSMRMRMRIGGCSHACYMDHAHQDPFAGASIGSDRLRRLDLPSNDRLIGGCRDRRFNAARRHLQGWRQACAYMYSSAHACACEPVCSCSYLSKIRCCTCTCTCTCICLAKTHTFTRAGSC